MFNLNVHLWIITSLVSFSRYITNNSCVAFSLLFSIFQRSSKVMATQQRYFISQEKFLTIKCTAEADPATGHWMLWDRNYDYKGLRAVKSLGFGSSRRQKILMPFHSISLTEGLTKPPKETLFMMIYPSWTHRNPLLWPQVGSFKFTPSWKL